MVECGRDVIGCSKDGYKAEVATAPAKLKDVDALRLLRPFTSSNVCARAIFDLNSQRLVLPRLRSRAKQRF